MIFLKRVIFQFRDQISKIVAAHFDEHKNLSRPPNFQKKIWLQGVSEIQ